MKSREAVIWAEIANSHFVRMAVNPQVFAVVRSCAKLSLRAKSAIFRVRKTAQRRLAVIRGNQSDDRPEPRAVTALERSNGRSDIQLFSDLTRIRSQIPSTTVTAPAARNPLALPMISIAASICEAKR